MLGQDLAAQLKQVGMECIGTDMGVNITDRVAVADFLDGNSVDFVVNCAAYTAVDKAESEEDKALAVNAIGPETLALETAARGIGIIHISTDYVLNGTGPAPLTEGAPLDPQNAYGRTKAKGEIRVLMINPRHWILRTAWLYGIHGNNFIKTMLRLMAEKEKLKVVNDQWGSPTWTVDLAQAIISIVKTNDHPGTYHFSDEGCITWHTFACEIQKQAIGLGLLTREIPIEPVSSDEYPTPAKRPLWSVMDKGLIRQTFSLQVPSWKDSLSAYLALEVATRA
jgi:dTDP-4-dehydrorhamnose reductase